MEKSDFEIIWSSLRISGMYLINLHTGTAKSTYSPEEMGGSENSEWDRLLADKISLQIHPRFRKKILKMYSLGTLREAMGRGERQIKMFCQRILDEHYHYITASITAYFREDSDGTPYAVFALKDIDKYTHREIRQTQNDKRIATLIKSRYNVMTTVHLASGICERIYLDDEKEADKVHIGNYEYYIQKAVDELIYEEDINKFLDAFSLDNLRKRAEEQNDNSNIICQYRIKTAPSETWVEEQVLFIRQDDSVIVNILGRDVTGEKLKEAAYKLEKTEKNNIISSMSNMFFATYYVDLESDTFRMATQIDEVGNILGTVKNYNEGICTYQQHFVHPDDRQEYLEKLSRENLIKTLNPDHPFVSMEYQRIKQTGNTFRDDGWILATVMLVEMENGIPKKALYVAQDVTASKEKEQHQHRMLKEACDAANHANAAKSEFLSRVSHDIRTPLNAIIGMTAIASSHLGDRERLSDCLYKIKISSKHLLSLINEVLDMSKIESGKIDLTEGEFNLSDLIENVLTMIRPAIQEKQHTLDVQIGVLNHWDVIGDAMRLQQVFMNILGNAVKYTPPGGRIEIQVTENPSSEKGYGCYEFSFQDNGIGMSEEYLKKIFEPFSRAEDTRINKIEGTGLGMTIALNIVHMMNGDIQVESEINKGSRFTVSVFLKHQNQTTAAEKQDTEKSDGQIAKNNSSPAHALSEPPENIENSLFSGKRILLVDDIEINREIAMEIIGSTGASVECAENGRQALEKFRETDEWHFDLIFMDIQMPEMNGYEATQAIRALDRTDAAQIPIIAMTANAFTEDVKASKKAGMNEHIAKPLNIDQMIDCMKVWLGKNIDAHGV